MVVATTVSRAFNSMVLKVHTVGSAMAGAITRCMVEAQKAAQK